MAEDKKTAAASREQAGTERERTYSVVPEDSAETAREAKAGKRAGREAEADGHRLTVSKEHLTWQHGIHHISGAHGQELSARARDLVRRALGELYQESQGAEPASEVAHKVADSVGNTDTLNRLGEEQHGSEYRGLNQRGGRLYG